MTIDTHEEYEAAMERLKGLADAPDDGAEQDEFFAISAAMVEYETRMHPLPKE